MCLKRICRVGKIILGEECGLMNLVELSFWICVKLILKCDVVRSFVSFKLIFVIICFCWFWCIIFWCDCNVGFLVLNFDFLGFCCYYWWLCLLFFFLFLFLFVVLWFLFEFRFLWLNLRMWWNCMGLWLVLMILFWVWS